MKLNPRIVFDQRKRLDQQLKAWEGLTGWVYRPPKGWIKAIREALGMSSRQLAFNMGKKNSEILALESRETDGRITLRTLEKAAEALHCRLVYAIIPQTSSLENLVHQSALKVAKKIVKNTSHSMVLEDQKVDELQTQAQVEDLAFQLEHKLDLRIWSQS